MCVRVRLRDVERRGRGEAVRRDSARGEPPSPSITVPTRVDRHSFQLEDELALLLGRPWEMVGSRRWR